MIDYIFGFINLPNIFNTTPILEAVIPLPIPDITPPVTIITFLSFGLEAD